MYVLCVLCVCTNICAVVMCVMRGVCYACMYGELSCVLFCVVCYACMVCYVL